MLDTKEKLSFQQSVRAEPSEVFRAFVSPAALRDWLCHAAQIEPRPGGRIYLAWNDGYQTSGVFTEFERGARLAFTWHAPGDPAPGEVRVRFASHDGSTTISLEHEGVAPGDAALRVREIWGSGLENLQSILETGWDQRFMRRPMFGISGFDILAPERAAKLGMPPKPGLLIGGVVDGMGAQAAGVQHGDVVVSVAGRPILTFESLGEILQDYRAGDQVEVEYYRGPLLKHVTMTLSARPVPEVPQTREDLLHLARTNYEAVDKELDELMADMTEAEAGYRPAPDEWNVKMVLAHLIAGERDVQRWTATMIGDNTGEEIFLANESPRLAAMAEVYSTARALADELKRSEAINVKLVEALPEEVVARKHLFNQLASWMAEFPDHHREHFAEIRKLKEAARRQ